MNIALGKPLINVLWVKRVLFRCDRKYLRKQTKNAFNEFVWEPIYVVGYAMGLGHWLLRCRACGVQASPDAIVADGRALRQVCSACDRRSLSRPRQPGA